MRKVIAMVLLATAALCGCRGEADNPMTPTADGGGLADSPYHNVRPPEEYFDLFPFHLDWVHDATGSTPSREDGPSYQSALQKLQDEGMEALTHEERQLIIVVSWYARVMQTHTLKYREEERDQEGETMFLMETQEQYEFKGTPNGPSPYPLASRTTPLHRRQGTVGDEFVDSYEIVDDGGQEDAVSTIWIRMADRWVCQRYKASGPYISNLVWPKLKPEFAQASPAGIEEVNGRPAYKLKAARSSGIRPFPQYLWLDVDTLIPVQEQYDERLGRYSIETVLEINGEVNVDPPDVSVPCNELDYGQ